jgi:hypothetical protein
MLAGMLSAEVTFLVIKGGAGDALIEWIRWGGFPDGEVLEFAIAAGILGVLLGSIGAACSAVLHHQPNAN